jgi:hypothetical protein
MVSCRQRAYLDAHLQAYPARYRLGDYDGTELIPKVKAS